MDTADLKADLKRIPPWAWIALGGGVLVLFLVRRGGGSAAVPTVAPSAAGIGATGAIPDPTAGLDPSLFQLSSAGLADAGYAPGSTTAPAASATPQQQITFAQTLGAVLPSVYSKNGFSGNVADSGQGTSDFLATLGRFGATDTSYQQWLAQLRAASNQGDVSQFHALLQQGVSQFGQSYGALTVAPVGTFGQFGTTAPAATGGGGDGPVHRSRDFFSLLGAL